MKNLFDAIIPIIIFITVVSGLISSLREAAAKNRKKQPTLPGSSQGSRSLRGVPQIYIHQTCGTATKMPDDVIRTYLQDPHFYQSNTTFCAGCRTYIPMGECRWKETGEDLQSYTNRLRAGQSGTIQNSPQTAVRPQPSRVQSEIAAFLTGAAVPLQPAVKQQAAGPQQQQQRTRTGKKNRSKQRTTGAAGKKTPATIQSAQQPKRPGSGVAAHVQAFIGDHVQSHMARNVDAHVHNDISERVRQNLGTAAVSATTSAAKPAAAAATGLLAFLRSPQGVRQAIVVNEILSKPRSLRKS